MAPPRVATPLATAPLRATTPDAPSRGGGECRDARERGRDECRDAPSRHPSQPRDGAPRPELPDDVLARIFEMAAASAAAVDGVDAAFVCRHAGGPERRHLRGLAEALAARPPLASLAPPRGGAVATLVAYCRWRDLYVRDPLLFRERYLGAPAPSRLLAALALAGGAPLDLYACPVARAVTREWAAAAKHRPFVRAMLRHDPCYLRLAARELRDDRALVLAAVRRCGCALAYASTRLRADPLVVEAAVREDGAALAYVAPHLQRDARTVGLAVDSNGDALFYAAARFRGDVNVVRRAMRTRPYVMDLAPPALWEALGDPPGDG